MNALTTEELVSLVAGTNVWETAPVERLGIPSIRVTDGPVGARGTRFDGPESINVPCSTSLAATWDPALVRRVGELLGREARAKGARVLLAPTVNLHRTPIGGRNFECMSEDPYLTAEQAVAYVEGVQSEGVACCIKHFVGNDTEFERNTIDSRIDERTLREKYLVPFEAAVTRAKVGSIMTAYNRLNGTFCADHTWLLDDVLRGEWGFDGLVMSDWFGLHSTIDGILAGCDLEMPGPPVHRGARLVAAIEAGEIDVDAVRTCARRVLEFVERWHGFEDGAPGPETTRDDPDDVALVREAGAHGAVLLQNRSDADGAAVLPLASSGLGRVAIIGPNAFHGQVLGGGSAHVNPTSISRPLDALTAFVEAAGGTVTSAPGCHIHKRLPSLSSRLRTPLRGAFFLHPDELDDPSAAPARSLENVSPHAMWNENPADPAVARHEFGARLSTTFTPDVSGPWQLSLATVGAGRLLIDGTVLIDTGDAPVGGSFFGLGTDDVVGTIDLVAGRAYEVVVELRRAGSEVAMSGLLLGGFPPVLVDLMDEAIDAAGNSDVAIVVVGTNHDWESEGWDRTSIELPGRQDELIRRVADASVRTVVVVNAGSPVAMPWIDEVDAVLVCWFPGQEMGNSLVDLLSGAVEPQGRLPVTFPLRMEDTPAFEHHPGRNGAAEYRERRLFGYSWYETVGRPTAFPFGFGLGYAEIELIGASVSSPHEVTVELANRSGRDGVEVVQVYVAAPGEVGGAAQAAPGDDEPASRLVGFARVEIPAGRSVTATVRLDANAYRSWDETAGGWRQSAGPRRLYVGRHAGDRAAELDVLVPEPEA
ncbi:MAG: glycoside hydrolase family 3 C-terminal domain-containing protein [Ilumatobacteraceae bacterium]